jgi:hypothetical protein
LLAHGLAHGGADEGRRGFLDDLLVATLDAAFALVQVKDGPMLVAQDLDLDMAGLRMNFSMNTRSSPKLFNPSRFTASKPSRTSCSL